jgi:hypothetical protein
VPFVVEPFAVFIGTDLMLPKIPVPIKPLSHGIINPAPKAHNVLQIQAVTRLRKSDSDSKLTAES